MPQAYINLVGTHFRDSEAKRLVNALVVGDDNFTFEREPDNEYDPNAIKVLVDDVHVGYLARANNHSLAEDMDNGAEPTARLIDHDGRKPVLLVEWDDVD